MSSRGPGRGKTTSEELSQNEYSWSQGARDSAPPKHCPATALTSLATPSPLLRRCASIERSDNVRVMGGILANQCAYAENKNRATQRRRPAVVHGLALHDRVCPLILLERRPRACPVAL